MIMMTTTTTFGLIYIRLLICKNLKISGFFSEVEMSLKAKERKMERQKMMTTTTCELIYTRLLICLPSTIYLKQNERCTMPCRSFHQHLFQNTAGCIFSNLFESLMAASSSMLCLCCQEVCLCIRVIVCWLGPGAVLPTTSTRQSMSTRLGKQEKSSLLCPPPNQTPNYSTAILPVITCPPQGPSIGTVDLLVSPSLHLY